MTDNSERNGVGLPVFLGLAILVLALRLPLHPISTLTPDESAYMLVARDILDGIWPFAGNFDHKPVGLYYLYAVAMALGGSDPSAIRWIATLSALVSALTMLWIAVRAFRLTLGVALALTTAWVFASFGLEGYSSNTEIILNAFAMLWLAAFLGHHLKEARWLPSAILSGVAAGFAIQVNYLIGPLLALCYAGGLLLAPRANFRWLLVSGLISIAIAVLHYIPLLFAGTLGDYFAMQATFLGSYQGSLAKIDWAALLPVLLRELFPLLGGAAFLFAYSATIKGHRDITLYGMLVAAGGLLVALASMRLFAHYFHLALPGIFLVAASSLARLEGLKQRMLCGAMVALSIPGLTIAASQIERGLSVRADMARDMAPEADRNRSVAWHFREETAGAQTGYVVCDHPVFYLLLDLDDVTDFPFFSHHIYPFAGIVPQEQVAAIRARQPDFMIIGAQCPARETKMVVDAFADYEPVDEHQLAKLYRAPRR